MTSTISYSWMKQNVLTSILVLQISWKKCPYIIEYISSFENLTLHVAVLQMTRDLIAYSNYQMLVSSALAQTLQ